MTSVTDQNDHGSGSTCEAGQIALCFVKERRAEDRLSGVVYNYSDGTFIYINAHGPRQPQKCVAPCQGTCGQFSPSCLFW